MIADVADGKEIAESLARQHGANSVASAITDVSDEAAVKALVAETMSRFGQSFSIKSGIGIFRYFSTSSPKPINIAGTNANSTRIIEGPA